MKRLVCIAACAVVTVVSVGCANRPFANQPVRNWLRGAFCNPCNPAAGQPAHCGTNVAPGCQTGCYQGAIEAPLGNSGLIGQPGQGVSYYDELPPGGTATSGDLYGNGTTGAPEQPPNVGPGRNQ